MEQRENPQGKRKPRSTYWLARCESSGNYRIAYTIAPSTTATSVVAISKVRRENRRDHFVHGVAPKHTDNNTAVQKGKTTNWPRSFLPKANPNLANWVSRPTSAGVS